MSWLVLDRPKWKNVMRPSPQPHAVMFLRRAPAGALAAGPAVAVLPLTYRCNVRCEMCTVWQREDPQTVGVEEFRRRLEHGGLAKHLEVANLTGGEPFLLKDLADYVRAVIAACPRLREVGIPTNGSMPRKTLDQVRDILGMLPSRVTLAMIVSLDGVGETHDRVRGVPGLFAKTEQTLRGIVALRAEYRNLTVGINMTVTPHNVADIERLGGLARDLGIGLTLTPAVDSDLFIDSASARDRWFESKEAWREIAVALRAHGERAGVGTVEDACRVLEGQPRQSPCVFWTRGVFVDADGGLYVCPVTTRGRFGSLSDPDDQGAWGSARHRTALGMLMATECRTCVSNCMSSEAGRDAVLARAAQEQRPVVIFGAGSGGRKVYQHLREYQVPVKAFVDNASGHTAAAVEDVPVHAWEAGRHCIDAFTIIASATGGGEIAQQLTAAGLAEGRDFVRYY